MTNWNYKTTYNHPSFYDIFEETFGALNKKESARFPYADVFLDEEEGKLYFRLAVAGYEKDKINIEVKDSKLEVSYDNTEDQPDDNMKYIERGITQRAFSRTWTLGPQVDTKSGKASFENGILTIEFIVESKEVNRIQIA